MRYRFEIKEKTFTYWLEDEPPVRVRTRPAAMKILRPIFSEFDTDREHLLVLLLNHTNEVLGRKLLAVGAQNVARVTPREVICAASDCRAYRIIMAHNHTTERVAPTKADRRLESKVRRIGADLQVKLLDHIIIPPPRIRPHRPWGKTEARLLVSLIAQNKTVRQIARAMRRSIEELEDMAGVQDVLLPGQKKYE